MNAQVRKLFVVVLAMFLAIAVSTTLIQFFWAGDFNSDGRNSRRLLQAAERDRGPIIAAGAPVAYSERVADSRSYQRTYPQGPLFAPVTGYFSAMNLSATGMELAENDVLEGEGSALFWQRMRNLFAGQERQGGGVLLSIDPELQQIAADGLGGRAGAAVVMEATTGRVLALYSSPSYDPNPLASLDTAAVAEAYSALDSDPSRPLINRAIGGDRYAPGSVFKIISAIALMENGVRPDTIMPSPPTTTLPLSSTEIGNIEGVECGSGEVTLTEAFARSCNTTFVIGSEQVSAQQMRDITDRFGFGDSLSIPLPVTPSVYPEDPDAAQLALSMIGQSSVAVTPMQMAMITQTVANGGKMLQPTLVDEILDANNQATSKTSPKALGNPISAEVAQSLTGMMQAVVNEPYGTGQSMALSGVSVAAKTGTAETGTDGRANAWAVGFAPAEAPKVVVAVVVEGDEADPVPHGGTVAGPIAAQLLAGGLE